MNRFAAPARWPGVSTQIEWRLLLTPYLAGTLFLTIAPALLSLALAFTHYDGLTAPRWAGLNNFLLIAADPLWWTALQNSLYFAALAVPLRLLGALALALLLNRPGLSLYRTAIVLPTIIPEAAYALLWLWIVNPLYGPLNQALLALGLPAPAWLVEPATAKLVFVAMALFQIGEGFVVLLAGLQAVPPDCYAAAAVDGASRWQVFRRITLPLLQPWLLLLAGRDLLVSLQGNFTAALLMTGGGPYYATLFTPFYIYEEAFDQLHLGQGAAMTLVLLALSLAVIGLLFRLLRGWGYRDEA